MTHKRHPLKAYVCECGAPFTSAGPNTKRCPDCSRYLDVARSRYCRRKGMTPEDRKKAVEEEYAKYLQALKGGKTPREMLPYVKKVKRKAKIEKRPCLYCGKPTRGLYCSYCRSAGFHWVHQVTGRTNGWDRN